jgi:hypothetical protein
VIMTVNSDFFCVQVFTSYPLKDYLPGVDGDVGIGGLILGLIYFVTAFVTFLNVRRNRQNALQGIEGASLRVIFPIYLPLLFLSALSDCFVGLVILFVHINLREANVWSSAFPLASAYACQHFVIEGTAFVLMQYGCGYQAFRNSFIWSIGWSLTTFLVMISTYKQGANNDVAFVLHFSWNWILLFFYLVLWLIPERKLYRRSAVRYYARFWCFIRLTVIISDSLWYFGRGTEDTSSICIYALVTMPIFVIFKPWIMYKSLLLDSVWWQGLSSSVSSGKAKGKKQIEGGGGNDGSLSLTKFVSRMVGMMSIAGERESGGEAVSGRASGLLRESSVSLLHNGSEDPEDGINARDAGRVRGSDLNSDSNSIQSSDLISSQSSNQSFSAIPSSSFFFPAVARVFQGKKYDPISKPLDGVEVGFQEAQELAKEVDNIHQEGTIRLINTAYLNLEKPQRLLGAGSFSKVYAGFYKGLPVAMKMLFTQDINPDVIKRCSNEAKILSEISKSPNVVKIFGVSVFPPRYVMLFRFIFSCVFPLPRVV